MNGEPVHSPCIMSEHYIYPIHEERARVFSCRTDEWKLVYDERGNRYELYDLRNDPEEVVDVFPGSPDVINLLMERLRSHLAGLSVDQSDFQHSPEVQERLRQLGYLE